jgi:hypothetical protein
MLLLPLILLLLACVLVVSHSSVTIFVCCLAGAAFSSWVLYSFGRGAFPVRLTWLLAAGLLLGYCGGDVTGQLIYALAGQDAINAIGTDSRYISFGLILVFLSCSGLLFAGNFEKGLFRNFPPVQFDAKLERFVWVYLVLIAAAYLHGDLAYSATNFTEGGQKVSVLAGICEAGAMALPPLTSLGFAQSTGLRKLRLGLLTLLSFAALIPVSRRDVFYSALVSIFCVLQLSGKEFHMSRLRRIVLGTMAFAAFVLSSLVFFGLRQSAVEEAQGAAHGESTEKVTLAEGIAAARAGVFSQPRMLFGALADNLQNRVFVINYLSLLARGGNTPSPLYGEDALFAVKLTIPDIAYDAFGVDKNPVRATGSEEGVANEHFGLNVTDEANSILTAGVIDFGLLGVMLYPLLLCFCGRKVLDLVHYLFGSRIALIAVILILCSFVQTEAELREYVTLFRNLLMISIECVVLFSVPSVIRRRRNTISPADGTLDGELSRI